MHRAFAVAVKWRWMDRNPADLATRPKSAPDDRDPPTTRDRTRPRATVPLRACHTSFMQTSKTYMIT
jgi:hypothetical protein